MEGKVCGEYGRQQVSVYVANATGMCVQVSTQHIGDMYVDVYI